MTTATPATPTPATPVNTARQAVLKDIHTKWSKFSEQEVAAFKTKDELVTQVMAKYSQERTPALHDVDTLLNGRSI